jgi:predicted dithiol-disulfide oxidoreductase (DUF899 family)
MPKTTANITIPVEVGKAEHHIVPHDRWIAARKKLLAKEKQFTRRRDELNELRRRLPWEKVEKQYLFDSPDGRQSLADLFGKHNQLLVYHFMFAPDWKEGCPHCSFWADHFDAIRVHLAARDTAFVVISRAPLSKIKPFKKRMGWNFKWVSSADDDFNYDFVVSFTPEQMKTGRVIYNYREGPPKATDREGASAFYKYRGIVYHTYSTYERGIDLLNSTYNWLDLTAKGRDEGDHGQFWVRFHDRYDDATR